MYIYIFKIYLLFWVQQLLFFIKIDQNSSLDRYFECEKLSTLASAVAFLTFYSLLPALAFAYVVYLLPINVYGHITLNTPVLVRSLKLGKFELCWYCDHLRIIFCPSFSALQGSKRCQTRDNFVPNNGAYSAICSLGNILCRIIPREHTVWYVHLLWLGNYTNSGKYSWHFWWYGKS